MLLTTISITKDFITVEEQRELEAWADSKWDSLPVKMGHRGLPRQAVWDGERRSAFLPDHPQWLIDRIGLGVIAAKLIMHATGSGTGEHIDTSWKQRANVLIRAADEGGLFEIEGEVIDFPERSLLVYEGETPHGVTKVTAGNRVLLAHFTKHRRYENAPCRPRNKTVE
jgi:hypothetical protein